MHRQMLQYACDCFLWLGNYVDAVDLYKFTQDFFTRAMSGLSQPMTSVRMSVFPFVRCNVDASWSYKWG